MSSLIENAELLSLLESSEIYIVNEVKKLITDNLQNNKEAWLVNALVDSFHVSRSKRCLEILVAVSEPHDKHLLDRLADYIKSGNQKTSSLVILAQVVRHEVVWQHKIIGHQLFPAVVKCLKVENDIPTLLIGCLTVTALLPAVPLCTSVGPHLQDIFECFSRLATFVLNKTGHVPEVYTLHLQVGINCMFQRLYGMFPCNFLTYLRTCFSRPGMDAVFNIVIEPMLDHVRMHPLLVTATKEKELALERWKEKEVQDIIVECARLSLDSTDIIVGAPVNASLPLLPHRSTTPRSNPVLPALCLPPDSESLTGLSPSVACSLSTPPPSFMTTKIDLNAGAVAPSVDMHGTNALSSSAGAAKLQRKASFEKKESPVPSSPLKRLTSLSYPTRPAGVVAKQTSQGQGQGESSPLPDRIPSAPALTIASSMHGVTKAKALTFEAPTEPVTKAASDDPELDLSGRFGGFSKAKVDPVPVTPSLDSTVTPSCTASLSDKSTQQTVVVEETAVVDHLDTSVRTEPDGNISDDGAAASGEILRVSISSSTTDDESSMSPRPRLPSFTGRTNAAQVAAFRREVKRIRFNSINVVKDTRRGFRVGMHHAVSCPTLHSIEPTTGADGEALYDSGQDVIRGRRGSDVIYGGGNQSSSVGSGSGVIVVRSPVMGQSGSEINGGSRGERGSRAVLLLPPVSVANAETQTSFYLLASTDAAVSVADNDVDFAYLLATEIESLLALVLPFAPFIVCYGCLRQSGEVPATETLKRGTTTAHLKAVSSLNRTGSSSLLPLFKSYSPSDLLDQHIHCSIQVHMKQALQAKDCPQMTPGVTGLCAELNSGVIRDEISLLHSQLLFERHRLELQAKRNRRLLGRTVKVIALEEKNAAMKDQLKVQEIEMHTLQQSLQQALQQNQQLKASLSKQRDDYELIQQANRRCSDGLHVKVKELDSSLAIQKALTDDLILKLDSANNDLFMRDKELEILRIKADRSAQLSRQVEQLNTELLLMGELHEKYQQRLSSLTLSHHEKPELQVFLQSAKSEGIALKKCVEEKTTLLEMEQFKATKMDKLLRQKELAILEQKKLLESTKATHRDQIQSYENKLKTEKQAFLNLQQKTLQLEAQLGLANSRPPSARVSVGPFRPSEGGSSPGSVEDAAVAYEFNQGVLSGEDDVEESAGATHCVPKSKQY